MIDYLTRNRTLAQRFIRRRIVSAVRLLNEPADDLPRIAWGPALVELDDHARFVFDCEESLSNIIVSELRETGPQWEALQRRLIRPPIATANSDDILHVLLTEQVTSIFAISRPHDAAQGMRRYYEMCGWRVHFMSGMVCIGTHLTIECIPSTAFYLLHEVDPRLSYTPLAVTG